MPPLQDSHLASVQRHRSKAHASAAYAQKKWLRQQRAAASPAKPQPRPRLRPRSALPEYTPHRRDARKSLAEVEKRRDIKHHAGLPSKTCRNCCARNYASLCYTKDPERFWRCDGGSTMLPPLGDCPELLKALLTETIVTSNGRIKRSSRSESFRTSIC